MNGLWIILLAMMVIVLGVVYLLTDRQKARTKQAQAAMSSDRKWQVQCPQCKRWKELPPIQSTIGELRQEDGQMTLQSSGKLKYHNQYKCPFCGHRWEEEYLE